MDEKVKEISVFVDESGSFDPAVEASQFHLVCMAFHDQSSSIAENPYYAQVSVRKVLV